MTMNDMSGQPRSNESIREAIEACKAILIKNLFALPLFTVNVGTIVDGLEELLIRRSKE